MKMTMTVNQNSNELNKAKKLYRAKVVILCWFISVSDSIHIVITFTVNIKIWIKAALTFFFFYQDSLLWALAKRVIGKWNTGKKQLNTNWLILPSVTYCKKLQLTDSCQQCEIEDSGHMWRQCPAVLTVLLLCSPQWWVIWWSLYLRPSLPVHD